MAGKSPVAAVWEQSAAAPAKAAKKIALVRID